MVHLVYCDNKSKELNKIIDGTKTMVIRGAAGRKIPHSRVFKDEIIYFMEKGTKTITAKAIVTNVENYIKLTEEEITNIIEKNNNKLKLTDKQKERWHKKCLCLIKFKNVETITPQMKEFHFYKEIEHLDRYTQLLILGQLILKRLHTKNLF